MFELTQFTTVYLSIFIILLGAIFIYFGKLIGDTQVEKYDKLGYHIEGLFFFAVYIFLPFLIAYYINDIFRVTSWVPLFVQLFILVCLPWNLKAHESLRKLGLLEVTKNEFNKRANQKLNEIKEHDSFVGRLIKSRYGEDWFKSKYGISYVDFYSSIFAYTYYKIPIKLFGNKYILLFFSLLTIYSNFQFYKDGELITFGFSLLLSLFILTMVALDYGYSNAYYPPAKIYLSDGETIEGKVLKFGEYVYLIKDDKKLFINKDKITYVEESVFKEKSDL
ncbi:MAG: hypothetical protein MUO76_22520 [Anaerolineaceae bacterium]|nr:hypothetical protein [Anaerolineaceae bacterium]